MWAFLKRCMIVVILCVIILGAFWIWTYVHNPQKMPVTKVIVQGAPVSTQMQVEQVISRSITPGFLAMKLPTIQQALEQLPWVDQVMLRRVWPGELVVTILPQKVVAYWNDQAFLNEEMEVIPFFSTIPISENLPRLYGPKDSQMKAGYYYQLLSQELFSLNLFIIQLQLTDNQDVSIMLNNGMKIQLGQEHILTRIKRFVKVYHHVFGQQKDVEGDVVDLRYPSGMAVVWGSK